MLKSNIVSHHGSAIRSLLLIGCLAVLLGLSLPATAWAGPPEPSYEGPEKCAECHPAETEAWQKSPHAKALTDIHEELQSVCGGDATAADCTCLSCHTTDFNPLDRTYAYGGVTCEACHGPYVEDHPKNGTMQLNADSSVCKDCHTETYQQWEASPHAQAGVQCIGCHLSHSQVFRLTDEALCGSCHRDRLKDFSHSAHQSAGVTCVNCHLSTTPSGETAGATNVNASIGGRAAPSHRFTVVSSQACVGCHAQTIHEEAPVALSQATNVRLLAMADRAPELANQLETAEQTGKSLRVMTFVSLGLGLGIGGMLGIVFMLVVGYINQGRAKT